MLSSVEIKNFKQRSEKKTKDVHDKPSMTLYRNLLKGLSRLWHNEFSQSHVVAKDRWKMLKAQLLPK